MLYQNLLMGEKTNFVNVGSVNTFAEHRHPEAEFIFCRKGMLRFSVEHTQWILHPGELALIAPMKAHAFDNPPDPERSVLVINAGPALLRQHFSAFTGAVFTPALKRLDDGTVGKQMLRELLEETAVIAGKHDAYSELTTSGNIYKICACILREYADGENDAGEDLRAVMNIEKALEMIRTRFAEAITVEQAADITGYGKSNFCRIFKQITGETFHTVLNRRRVENACFYLAETAMPIAEIAPLVGFADSKAFCRVFRVFADMTPGQYRALQHKG